MTPFNSQVYVTSKIQVSGPRSTYRRATHLLTDYLTHRPARPGGCYRRQRGLHRRTILLCDGKCEVGVRYGVSPFYPETISTYTPFQLTNTNPPSLTSSAPPPPQPLSRPTHRTSWFTLSCGPRPHPLPAPHPRPRVQLVRTHLSKTPRKSRAASSPF